MKNDPKADIKREVAARAQGTRQKIVAAALDEFARHGRDGARIDRIARSAGVNKAMIYYHFDSKDILYKEVVISFYRRIRERAESNLQKADTLEDALIALARIHADTVLESDQLTPIILREMANPTPEILDAIAELFAASGIPQTILTRINQEMEAGRCRKLDLKQVMVSFIGMSLGYYLIAPMADRFLGIEDRRGLIDARPPIIADLFLNGLKVREEK